ncbi:patatin-like phospholipase family protein [Bacillus sp. B15-48]|uniref:patatin-like phospholipase family protein n=1 Tax=Bacillus sp. B15-48 TaxID=1548601 RepID=UPI00193F9EBC|nr:patatin-like phospholipase family protein [Bacillus sp. B15-48]
MKKIGLVLAGGGGKGAYHVGVWKALKEFGVDQNIKAIAGTSVGALNTALFLQGDLKVAEKVWLEIRPEKILTPNTQELLTKAMKYVPAPVFDLFNRLSEKIIGHGWFSRAGLLEIIRNYVDLSSISTSQIPCFATCMNARSMKPEYMKLNLLDEDKIESVLLASSAIPFIFDPVKIDGQTYWDGGLPVIGDNLPIRPLYEIGCDVILLVHLGRTAVVEREQFPNAHIVEIVPKETQGGFFTGTLDFTPSGSRRRIEQGYRDTINILQPIFQMAVVQQKMSIGWNELKNSEHEFNGKHKDRLAERENLKKELYHLLDDTN